MIRIWSDGKRTRVVANGYDITDDVISVEWEHEAKEEATARIRVRAARLDAVVKTLTVEPSGDDS